VKRKKERERKKETSNSIGGNTSKVDFTSMERVLPTAQCYAWGKLGMASLAAQMATASPHFVPDKETPYAELWMGTHPTAPSTLQDGRNLREVLDEHRMGKEVFHKYKGELPFLFKVLSIRKALSIQAHPDKELAITLFNEFPHIYKDNNHKPEMVNISLLRQSL
jgi:mannose-6-phosphate isomerase